MLYVNIDYPILHSLCCCLGKKAREIFWYLIQNHEILPIRRNKICKDLKISKVVCCRALQDLVDYNIVYWDKNRSIIGLSTQDYEPFDGKRNSAYATSPLIQNPHGKNELSFVKE